MSLGSLLVDVLGPVVLLVGVGAVAGPRLGIEARPLSTLSFWILGPAFVFDLFVTSDLPRDLVVRLVLAGLAGMAAAALAAGLAIGTAGVTRSVLAASVMTAAYGNVGNAGLAVSVFALGEAILPAAAVLMLTINLAGIALGVGLARGHDAGLGAAVVEAARAPMTMAAVAAVAVNALALDLPLVVERSTGLLAQALIPVMLVTLGIQLSATHWTGFSSDLVASGAAKLLVAPGASAAAAAALGLEGDVFGVVVIQAAMPPAVFCVVLAIEHRLEPDQVTNTVVATTLASLVTLPIVLRLVT